MTRFLVWPSTALVLTALGVAAATHPPSHESVGPRESVPAPPEASSDSTIAPKAPASLRGTGLYSDWDRKVIAKGNHAYAPQYPLWTDGAEKRRWVSLPDGATIDGSNPDAWVFPVGTRFWKEFAFGRPVETRYMERTSSGWTFATYVWTEDGSDAVLAPERGLAKLQVTGELAHSVPSETDCRACHDTQAPVLGFSALQLSPDRDPLAPHAVEPAADALDLATLVQRGLIRDVPAAILRTPPRVRARSATERAAIGYLHGNCGGCHNPESSPPGIDMTLSYALGAPETSLPGAIATTFARPSSFSPSGNSPSVPALRIAPGEPDRSVLLTRLSSRDAVAQMPPLGTHRVDQAAVELVKRWIAEAPSLSTNGSTQITPTQGDKT